MAAALCSMVACTLEPDSDETSSVGSGPVEDESGEAGSTDAAEPITMSAEGSGEAGSASGADPSATSTGGSTGDGGSNDDGTSDEPGTEESGDTGSPFDCTPLAHQCVSFAPGGGELVLYELDTGIVLDTLPVPFDIGPSSHSITWVGDGVYVCGGNDETLHRVDVLTGVTIDSGLPCSGVAEVQGDLLVRLGMPFGSGDYARYDDFAAAMAGAPLDVTSYPPDVHRFTATEDTLVSAWHSTNQLEVHELSTAALVSSPFLEDHDDWILGMDVIDGQVVINTWFSDPLRHIAFDLATGARTCELPSVGDPLDHLYGLACRVADEPDPPPPPPPA
jgi:hypothetical protein